MFCVRWDTLEQHLFFRFIFLYHHVIQTYRIAISLYINRTKDICQCWNFFLPRLVLFWCAATTMIVVVVAAATTVVALRDNVFILNDGHEGCFMFALSWFIINSKIQIYNIFVVDITNSTRLSVSKLCRVCCHMPTIRAGRRVHNKIWTKSCRSWHKFTCPFEKWVLVTFPTIF